MSYCAQKTGLSLRFGLAIALLTILVGCQSVAIISTDPPGSEVFVGGKSIGVTPVQLNAGSGAKVAGGYLAEIRRTGYSRVWVWVPVGLLGLDINLNLKTFANVKVEDKKQSKNSASRIVINRLTAQMLQLQQKMLDEPGDGSDSQKELADLLDSYPDVGSLHFLRAIDQLKGNKFGEARNSLVTAMKYSPKEYDFLALLNLVGNPSGDSKEVKGEAQ